MTIGGSAWTTIELPIRKDGAAKYLGYMTYSNYYGKKSKAKMIKIIKAPVAAIIGSRSSPR